MSSDIKLRDAMNAKRPAFTVSNATRRKRVSRCSWRSPRGLQNKEKKGFNGKKAVVNVGYRGPASVRGFSSSGKSPVLVHNLSELCSINAKMQCAVIASVGMKNRQSLLEECKVKGIEVLNWKVDAALAKITDVRAKKAESKKAKKEVKKKVESKKVEKKTEEVSTEDKKEVERKEMEKVLTRRD